MPKRRENHVVNTPSVLTHRREIGQSQVILVTLLLLGGGPGKETVIETERCV